MVDILLTGGTVVDGTGIPGIRADVAIQGDRIIAVGTIPAETAKQTIDCTGCVITPGFIDAHVHGDLPLQVDPTHEQAIRQGVTTYICGQDGVAFAPGSEGTQTYMRRYTAGFNGRFPSLKTQAQTVAEFLARFDGLSNINVANLVPNGNVRMEVMGLDQRQATRAELQQMQQLVKQGMDEGAVGLSSGLDYIPSIYADKAELTELCKAIAPVGGVYVTHMRGYTPTKAPPAMAEVFAIGNGAGCPVHISHFNCLAEQAIPILDATQADVTFDLYPYLYGSTTVAMLCLPPELCDGGVDATLARLQTAETRTLLQEAFNNPRFPIETIQLASCPHPDWVQYEGQRLVEAVGSGSMVEFVCELLVATDLAAGCVIRHYAERQEQDILALMRDRRMLAGSDGIYVGGYPHPRGTGCFARYLGHHVRAGHWTLEEAVAKCSNRTAERFQLKHRGRIQAGYYADIAVFEPDKIQDHSTLANGKAYATGMQHVFVNGITALQNGEIGKNRPGRGLRRGI